MRRNPRSPGSNRRSARRPTIFRERISLLRIHHRRLLCELLEDRRLLDVHNLLIAAAGDSYSSGEGNPRIEAHDMKPSDLDLIQFGYNGVWGFSKDTVAERRANNLVHRSPCAASALLAQQLEQQDPQSSVKFIFSSESGATIDNSVKNAPTIAPDQPYCGISYEPYYNQYTSLEKQFQKIKDEAGSQQIDILTLSFGGNDIGFSRIATCLLLNDEDLFPVSHHTIEQAIKTAVDTGTSEAWDEVKNRLMINNPENTEVLHSVIQGMPSSKLHALVTSFQATDLCISLISRLIGDGIPSGVISDIVGWWAVVSYAFNDNVYELAGINGPDPLNPNSRHGLIDEFNALNDEITNALTNNGLGPKYIYITEYPAPFLDSDGTLVSITSDVIPGLEISQAEAEWLKNNVLDPLNQAVHSAADTFGWTYVGEIVSAFAGHSYGGEDGWFRTSVEDAQVQGGSWPYQRGILHPTQEGHAQIASLLFDLVTQPTADAGGPYRGEKGTVITLDGSGSSVPACMTGRYEWDLDNDGQFDDGIGESPLFYCEHGGEFPIGLRVTSIDGSQKSFSYAAVVVADGTISASPILSSPCAVLVPGGGSNTFQFQIHYYHASGTAPQLGVIHVSGEGYYVLHPVNPGDDPANCVYASESIVMQAGTHNHFFQFYDGSIFATTPTISGPYVDVQPGNALSLARLGWDDRSGDGDNVPETGEQLKLGIRLENTSGESLSGVRATLATSDSRIQIINREIYCGTVGPHDTLAPGGRFEMRVLTGATVEDIPFQLHLSYVQGDQEHVQDLTFTETFFEPGVRGPQFIVDHITWDDTRWGDGDGVLESGEQADMIPSLRNVGNASAEHVDVMVHGVADFRIDEEWERYPNMTNSPSIDYVPIDAGHFNVRDLPLSWSGTTLSDIEIRYGDLGNGVFTIQDVPIVVTPVSYLKVRWADTYESDSDFGVVAPGATVTKQLWIENPGSAELVISAIETSFSDIVIEGFTPGLTVLPGGRQVISVHISPAETNASISREFRVTSNGQATWLSGFQPAQTLRITGTITDCEPMMWEQISALHSDGMLRGMATGDTDGDGQQETIVVGEWTNQPRVYVYRRIGDQYQQLWNSGTAINGVLDWKATPLAVADMNSDGKDDIVVATYDGQVMMIQWQADNTWSISSVAGNFGVIYEVGTGDSDGDGQRELFLATATGGVGHVYVLENGGGTSFGTILHITQSESDGSPYHSFGGFVSGDSDDDGHQELLFTSGNRANGYGADGSQLFIYESVGNNSYVERFAGVSYETDQRVSIWSSARLGIGDLDGDGRNEITVAQDGGSRLWILESPGDNVWMTGEDECEFRMALPARPSTLSLTDVDQDGRPEILLGMAAPVGVTGFLIVDGFGQDGDYLERWKWKSSGNWVYSVSVDRANGADPPSLILGVDVGSDAEPDVLRFEQTPPKDLAVAADGIIFSNPTPFENEQVTVSATVCNRGVVDLANVTIRFFQGNPAAGGVQIGADQVIASLPAGGVAIVEATWDAWVAGMHEMYVVVDPQNMISELTDDNNLAHRSITVTDIDTQGPAFVYVDINEFAGDGDGTIGADEQVHVVCFLDDASGIADVAVLIDGEPATTVIDRSSMFAGAVAYTVLSPLSAGPHSYVLTATDAGNSPAESSYTGSFEVVPSEEITLVYQGTESVADDQAAVVDLGAVLQGSQDMLRTFFVRNDGTQALRLESISVPAPFTVSGPTGLLLQPGEITSFTLILASDVLGTFSGEITLCNSDASRSPDGLDEGVFTFSVIARVKYPPILEATSPELDRGRVGAGTDHITIQFNEPVVGADLPANCELRGPGADGLLGTSDDLPIPISVTCAGSSAELAFAGLTPAIYRLTLHETITDRWGYHLDGDADRSPGTDYTCDFVVLPGMTSQFLPASVLATPRENERPKGLATADVDKDGNLDLLWAESGSPWGDVACLRGAGNGTFADFGATGIGVRGVAAQSITVGDFNADGWPDIFVEMEYFSGWQTTWVYLNDGRGNLLPFSQMPFSGTGFATADFNHDGADDLAYLNSGVQVRLADGQGGFLAPTTVHGAGRVLLARDFNKDGWADLAVGWDNLAVLLNDGSGGFLPAVTSAYGIHPTSMASADFNVDGRPDLAVTNSSGSVAVLINQGAGQFNEVYQTAFAGATALSVAAADLDGDTWPDIIAPDCEAHTIRVLYGNEDGRLWNETTFDNGLQDYPGYLVTGDFNNDGTPDVAVSNLYGNSASVFVNSGKEMITLVSPNGYRFDIQQRGPGAGQLIQGTSNSFDGLNRLQVGGSDFAPDNAEPTLDDGGRTVVTQASVLAGLRVHREVTVVNGGNEDYARTLEVFENLTANPITTTVRIAGNLGSDAATNVFATSDGDADLETTDRWFVTDDTDGAGSRAVVHYMHGWRDLVPFAVLRTGDNVEWTYQLTVPAHRTVRLASFTIVAASRATAIAAAEALVSASGFQGRAGDFLTAEELASLANFDLANEPPAALALSTASVAENRPAGTVVGELSATDGDPWDTLSYSLVAGAGSDDNASFSIDGTRLTTREMFDFESKMLYHIRIRTTDPSGSAFEQFFAITVTDIDDSAPTVLSIAPALDGNEIKAGIMSLTVRLSECMKDADLATHYELYSSGTDSLIGTADDAVITATVTSDGQSTTLQFDPLRPGTYRLVVRDSLVDLAGNRLDGNGDGVPGDAYLHDFLVRPAFSDVIAFSTGGLQPRTTANADFNGDGFDDLAVVNVGSGSSDGTVGILLGNGAGVFSLHGNYAAGDYRVQSLAVGDFNSDDIPDVAVTLRNAYKVALLLGDGTGGLGSPFIFSCGGWYPDGVAAEDLNGDGKTDLAVTYFNDMVGVRLGNGQGGFGSESLLAAGGRWPSAIKAVDINGDDKKDLVVAVYQAVSVLLASTPGQFASAVSHPCGGDPCALTVSDLNADGHPDVVTANSGGDTIGILLGNGQGGFSAPSTIPHDITGPSIAAGDFDLDGKVDLALPRLPANQVDVFRGDGLGGFSLDFTLGSGGISPSWVLAEDFNVDGKQDLAVVNRDSNNIGVLLNTQPAPFVAKAGDWTQLKLTLRLENDGRLHLYHTDTTMDAVLPQLVQNVTRVIIASPSDPGYMLTVDCTDASPLPTGNLSYSGGGGLIKTGAATLTLSAANTYTGGTTVEAGTLVIGNAGALPPGRSLSIGSGGTLVLGGGLSLGTMSAVSGMAVTSSSTICRSSTSALDEVVEPLDVLEVDQTIPQLSSVPASENAADEPRAAIPASDAANQALALDVVLASTRLKQAADLAWVQTLERFLARTKPVKNNTLEYLALDQVLARFGE